MVEKDLIGAWKLVSFELRHARGGTTHPFGEDVGGVLTYDAEGNFSVQIARADRPPFASGDMQGGTDDEIRSAYLGYIAYFGSYEVNERERYVVHHVRHSLFPNWEGGPQRRYLELSGDSLVLSTPPVPWGGESITGVLTWERTSS